MEKLKLSIVIISAMFITELSANLIDSNLHIFTAQAEARVIGAQRTVVAARGPRGGAVVGARRTVVGGRPSIYNYSASIPIMLTPSTVDFTFDSANDDLLISGRSGQRLNTSSQQPE